MAKAILVSWVSYSLHFIVRPGRFLLKGDSERVGILGSGFDDPCKSGFVPRVG
jgi:hypothetical protein